MFNSGQNDSLRCFWITSKVTLGFSLGRLQDSTCGVGICLGFEGCSSRVAHVLCSWETDNLTGMYRDTFDGGKLAPLRATKLLHFLSFSGLKVCATPPPSKALWAYVCHTFEYHTDMFKIMSSRGVAQRERGSYPDNANMCLKLKLASVCVGFGQRVGQRVLILKCKAIFTFLRDLDKQEKQLFLLLPDSFWS